MFWGTLASWRSHHGGFYSHLRLGKAASSVLLLELHSIFPKVSVKFFSIESSQPVLVLIAHFSNLADHELPFKKFF